MKDEGGRMNAIRDDSSFILHPSSFGRAVFLDRDGVLNHAIVREGKPHPPRDLGELRIVDEAAPALQRLRDAGYRLIVVTNQPDVARGTTTRETVDAINARIGAA